MRSAKTGLFCVALLLSIVVQLVKSETLNVVTDSPLYQLLQHFEEDARALDDFYRLPLSKNKNDRINEFHQQWKKRLGEISFNELKQSGKIDYLLLKNHLWYMDKQYEFQNQLDEETLSLLPFANSILALEEARWKITPIEPEKAADELTNIKNSIKQIQDNIKEALENEAANGEDLFDKSREIMLKAVDVQTEEAPAVAVTAVIANRAAEELERVKRTLNQWFEHYNLYHPTFHWWVHNVYDETNKTLDDYRTFLRDEVAGYEKDKDPPLIGDPIGKERLLTDLQHEMVPYSPEELIEIANREFAWCEREMDKASRELGFENDWHSALEYVKGLHVPPGEQDQLVYRQSVEAIEFLDQRDLVTIPDLCRETWRLEMISKERQKFNPFAFYGGQYMGVSYPTLDMDPDAKRMSMRGNNIHFSRLVTPHELIPGHHLQRFMADRYNTHRQQFWTPFLVEGWALYWEMLLWDMDYPRGPEDRIGMLFWRMHRCARIIVSLKFHLNEMTPQEMIDFLVERVGHERDGATSEVRRFIGGGYSPLYQCAYMLGGLQFMALRRELVDTGTMTNREFHDAILQENEIPVALIRAKLMNLELSKDEMPQWRFYEGVE